MHAIIHALRCHRQILTAFRHKESLRFRDDYATIAKDSEPVLIQDTMRTTRTFFRTEISELLRPWKLIALALGIILLIIGGRIVKAIHWDVPISFIMAILAYLCAPASIRIIREYRWRLFPIMLIMTWFTVDGSYWLYWSFRNPAVLQLMRKANLIASFDLYVLCGLIWQFHGSLSELIALCRLQLRKRFHRDLRREG